MLIYKKYIAQTILYPFIALSFVLTSLVWITQILKLLYLLEKGVELIEFLNLIILIIPSIFFMISPLISVLAVIYVYNKIQENRQLIILRVGGLSNFALAKPGLLVVFCITLVSYYISLYLMPFSYSKLKHDLNNFRQNYISTNIINAKSFNQISKDFTIYLDKKSADGNLEGVILFDNRIPKDHTILFAKTGKIIIHEGTPLFQLRKGFRQSFDNNNNITKLYFDELLIAIKNEDTSQNDRSKTSLELYVSEMLQPNSNLPEESKVRLIVDGHQRLIWPLFNYALVFLALTMFLTTNNDSRKSNTKQLLYTFLPVMIVAYFHFTLQKAAYKEPLYIFVCYLNIFVCIVFSIWKINKSSI